MQKLHSSGMIKDDAGEILLLDRDQAKCLIRDMGESLIVLGPDACVSFVNKSTLSLLGYSEDGMRGVPFGKFVADDNLEFFNALREIITKGPIRDLRLECLAKDGRRVPVRVNGSALRDASTGVFLGVIIVARDMRDMVALVKELEDAKAGLEEKVKERTSELEAALEELKSAQARLLQKEKMASVGQLAAGLAHEINNPTAYVLSNLSSLEIYIKDLLKLTGKYGEASCAPGPENMARLLKEAEELKEKIEFGFIVKDVLALIREARQGAQRVKGIVNDIRDFSHIDAIEASYADINACIENTINMALNGTEGRIRLARDYGRMPEIRCNPGELNQVFMNLLINAAQAMDGPGEIRVATRHGGGWVSIEITDSGCGIPADVLPRVFEPFFTTKPVGQGTGLGLAIAYSIIKKHGGEITVESAPGKGSTFKITLPGGI